MTKIKCVISYDGTNFSGMQIQPRTRTVEGEINKALRKIHKGEPVRIFSSGRTDAGVHAKGQTFHFETDYKLTRAEWKRALNTLLPSDLHVNDTREVNTSFHARFDAAEKEYRYYILNEQERDVFQQNYVYQYPYELNIKKMQQAAGLFEGAHDFTTFSSAKAETTGSKVRTLYEVSCYQGGSRIEFILRGDGFLYNMVRIIVGTLLDVGRGKLNPSEIAELFNKHDRQCAGDTVPPQGLYLWEVTYKEDL
ncbi:tRNA pseudouridine(38-40) synthase TruA [Lentibacillus amyloliquefaciens]|uniref:tRNA pseudouridine synthase A n=1 Tax=Lentibacillus amyloliquefaciens TaxID=1472767 RepID=A0A0U4F974_9BACI|nr:tRNA pseudouridine(38-40) synthase TruA [Lentibacillus amyloliquefaciens]ALX49363.1 tRNA pseudouridine synthase A [Lentibacillus amyloliquefaciens]